jgi:hypothetical protein
VLGRLDVPYDKRSRLLDEINELTSACATTLRRSATVGPGARKKDHISYAVRALAKAWAELSGSPFTKNLQVVVDKEGNSDFSAPSPVFVYHLLRAIDSNVTHSETLTALKAMKSVVK